MITDTSTPLRCDLPWRNIEGNVIVVKPTDGILYPLNSVATQIWLLSDGAKRVCEIVEALVGEFDAPKEQIQKDTCRFLAELEKASLIQRDS